MIASHSMEGFFNKSRSENLSVQFARAIKGQGLLSVGDSCVLAVSGGLDSTTMLHLFTLLAEEWDLHLAVVHVNHKIRGKEAKADQDFVRMLASKYGLPFHTTEVDAPLFAKEEKLSPEESARVLRYDFFSKVLDETGFDWLATGHTKNDQAETILDHFLRGSGIAGMRGILQKRQRFIRPLLSFSRSEITDYASQNELQHSEDSSNSDLSLRRNRIRNELVPYLRKHLNPGILDTLERTAFIFREVEMFAAELTGEASKSLVSLREKNEIILDIAGFLGYNEFVQKCLIAHFYSELSTDRYTPGFNKLSKALELVQRRKPGRRTELGNGISVMVDHDGIVVGKLDIEQLPRSEINLVRGNNFRYGDILFSWSIFEASKDIEFSASSNCELFDFDKTGPALSIHGVYAGALFCPLGLRGRKRVGDFLTDKKVPIRKRATIPLLEAPTGIIWICGYRIDERFKVSSKTSRILKVEMEK